MTMDEPAPLVSVSGFLNSICSRERQTRPDSMSNNRNLSSFLREPCDIVSLQRWVSDGFDVQNVVYIFAV